MLCMSQRGSWKFCYRMKNKDKRTDARPYEKQNNPFIEITAKNDDPRIHIHYTQEVNLLPQCSGGRRKIRAISGQPWTSACHLRKRTNQIYVCGV